MGHDHLNLICESCGKIDDIDIEVPDVRAEAREKKWLRHYQVPNHSLWPLSGMPEATIELKREPGGSFFYIEKAAIEYGEKNRKNHDIM